MLLLGGSSQQDVYKRQFEGEIDWSYQPGPDPEFIFQMNRHQYWICLGQAYAMTGDEAYAECFASQLVHWIKKNPLTEETKGTTWRRCV